MEKFYITTPIYYVNDVPHIGHTYTTVATDVLARWNRLRGRKVFFLTGTDEHGTKILESASAKNYDTKKYCDEVVEQFKTSWQKMNISYDFFIRTTDKLHEDTVKKFLNDLFSKGEIYKAKYRGNYCVQCERSLNKSELIDGLCPDHKIKPREQSEENYFFKLSKYQEKLIELISDEKKEQHFDILPETRKNEILGKLKSGLEDISISRANLPWGIPLPFDTQQTTYVWVDALLNYISGINYYNLSTTRTLKSAPTNLSTTATTDKTQNPSVNWPADLHLMAKDILWFHSVIWPALLLAVGIPLPKKVYAHGFFTVNGQKMSKTIGNVIQPEELIKQFGVDATRYLLLSAFPFGSDGNISLSYLQEKYNTDLANNLGNLISRIITMLEKYTGGKVPKPNNEDTITVKIQSELKTIEEYLDKLEFSRAIDQLQKCIDLSNSYIESKAPWKLAKEKNKTLNGVLYNLSQIIWLLAHYLFPFMPDTSQQIWEQIGQKTRLDKSNFFSNGRTERIKPDTLILHKKQVLFPRI